MLLKSVTYKSDYFSCRERGQEGLFSEMRGENRSEVTAIVKFIFIKNNTLITVLSFLYLQQKSLTHLEWM